MKTFLSTLLLAAALFAVGNAHADCEPGRYNPFSNTCSCPPGYEHKKLADKPVCVKTAVDPKTSSATACKSGDLDDCTKKCDAKILGACVALGQMYSTGKGVSLSDPEKGYDFFKKACDGGDLDGCVEQGRMLASGTGVKKDVVAANKLFAKACDGNDASGCREIANNYLDGKGVKPDTSKALELYEKACTGSDYPSCAQAGYMHFKGHGTAVDVSRAQTLFTTACKAGYASSCYNLGILYSDGALKDLPKAATYFDNACALKHGDGCSELGTRYMRGSGVTADAVKAHVLFEKGCTLGSIDGCYDSGFDFFKGEGVAKDEKAAATRFDKACKADHQPACYTLGFMYFEGLGVARDDAKGASLVLRACDQGKILDACFEYARAALAGRGTKKDSYIAHKYAQRVCDAEPGPACKFIGDSLRAEYPDDKAFREAARSYYEKGCHAKHEPSCKALADVETAIDEERKAAAAEKKRFFASVRVKLPVFGNTIDLPNGADYTIVADENYRKRPVVILERESTTGHKFRISIARDTMPCKSLAPLPDVEDTRTSPAYLPTDETLRGFYSQVVYEGRSADDLRYAFVCADLRDGSAFHITLSYGGDRKDEIFVVTSRTVLSTFARGMIDAPPSQFELIDDQGRERTWKSYLVRGDSGLGGLYLQPRTEGQKDFGLFAVTAGMLFSTTAPKKFGVGLVGGFDVNYGTILGILGDTSAQVGVAAKLGPLHVAPLFGGGLDGAFTFISDFRLPVAPYYFYGGDVRLRLGRGRLGLQLMYPRRANEEISHERRYALSFSYDKFSITGHYWELDGATPENVPRMVMLTFGQRFASF